MNLKNFWKTFCVLAITSFFAITAISTPAFAAEEPTGIQPTFDRPTLNRQRVYKLTIKTQCKVGAGTNANVEVNLLNGRNGTGFERIGRRKNFKRCSNETFNVRAKDIGNPTAITLKADQTGALPRWKVEYVKIDAGTLNQKTCNFYLSLDKKNPQSTRSCR